MLQALIHSLESKPHWKKATDLVESVSDVSASLPWFLACNPSRFPYWWGRPDPRNMHLLTAMRGGDT